MTVRNAIIALALAISPAAFAANQAAPMFHNAFVKMATKPLVEARSTQPTATPIAEGNPICNPKGTACYPDAAHFCCSNLCVDGFCD